MNYVLNNKDYEKCPTLKLKVVNILLNSGDCTINSYTGSYVWHLQEELRDVVAIRPLRMEMYRPSTNVGELVINGVSIPIQVNTTQGGYLNLNDYRKIVISNPVKGYYSSNAGPVVNNDLNIFHRMVNGVDLLPTVKDDIFNDPYTYIFKPMERRLNRFEAKLYDTTYNIITDATVVALLSVYCVDANCNY
jgi:hypothetical protein